MNTILTIDIGNSTTKFGIFEDDNLIKKFSTATDRQLRADQLHTQIAPHLNNKISAVIVSSVVPELENAFRQYFAAIYQIEPIFVDHRFDFGLKIKYFPPETLGSDRIVAAFATAEKYGTPCIVCDFGTATTIDYVNSKNEYLGGIITPGISTLSDALFRKTSKLPKIEIEKPENIIGNSTAGSIQSGIYFGYISLAEGLLQRMIIETGENPKIVATGGFAALIAHETNLIEVIDENLILDGLQMIYSKTLSQKKRRIKT